MSHPLHAFGTPMPGLETPLLGRVTSDPIPPSNRGDHILFRPQGLPEGDLEGYAAVLIGSRLSEAALERVGRVPGVHSLSRWDHFSDGDVLALQPRGYVRTLYRKTSSHNAIFATDRCNSYCLMCSQPPRPVDDSDRIREHLRLIDLMDPETLDLGITGGEPTLLKDDLLAIVQRCKDRLPNAALHILSNGRLFYYGSFAKKLSAIQHPDLMIGVPLYSDRAATHDYVVQCKGAFRDTVIGLQNLGRYGVPVEIRIVLHRWTYARLLDLAEFIFHNLTFASHVAFMGLEPMGFAVPNLNTLWIDPVEFAPQLREAVAFLSARGMNVSIYNAQLCTTPRELWPYCRQSISDWKNEYLPECARCLAKAECGGFFTSALRRKTSSHIRAITDL